MSPTKGEALTVAAVQGFGGQATHNTQEFASGEATGSHHAHESARRAVRLQLA